MRCGVKKALVLMMLMVDAKDQTGHLFAFNLRSDLPHCGEISPQIVQGGTGPRSAEEADTLSTVRPTQHCFGSVRLSVAAHAVALSRIGDILICIAGALFELWVCNDRGAPSLALS